MLTFKYYKGNKVFCFISFFIFFHSQLFSQQKQTAQPFKLLYSECGENCYRPEVKEMNWQHDTLEIIFSCENGCSETFFAEIIPSLNDTLNILTTNYAKGIKGSKYSVPPVKTDMCLCIFNYTLTLSKAVTHPKVILLNNRPFYMLKEMKGDHTRFNDYFKNNSERVSCKNFENLLGLDRSSAELVKLYNELGNDSILDNQEKDFRVIHFPEDHIYLSFDRKNKLQSIFFEEGYNGDFAKNINYKSKAGDYLKKLGKPTKISTYTNAIYDKSGNVKHIPYPAYYYFAKQKLFLGCDNEDNITSIRFSLELPKDDF